MPTYETGMRERSLEASLYHSLNLGYDRGYTKHLFHKRLMELDNIQREVPT